MKNAAIVVSALLTVFVTLPIWFSLMYLVLQSINATPVMWLLYWVYLPVSFFVAFLLQIIKAFD